MHPLHFVPHEPARKDKNAGPKPKKPEVTFDESVREHKISWLAKLDPGKEEAVKLYQELLAANINDDKVTVQIHTARLAAYDVPKLCAAGSNPDPAKVKACLEVTEAVMARLKHAEAFAAAAVKNDGGGNAAAEARKEAEKTKETFFDVAGKWVTLLVARGLEEDLTEADRLFLEVLKYADPTDSKVSDHSFSSHFVSSFPISSNVDPLKNGLFELIWNLA